MIKQTDKEKNLSLQTEKEGRGNHPNSQANLKPFEKGVSGNPLGRPQKYAKLKKALDNFGKKKVDTWQLGSTCDNYKDEVLERIWYEASQGSISHIKILAELGCLDAVD